MMNKYQRTLPSTTVDVYDILHAYDVRSHALGHAVKKLLMAGQRGHKDYQQDLREAVQAIEREIVMAGQAGKENTATGDSGSFMDRPSWSDAPDWANWLAQDENGKWHWCEKKPVACGIKWIFDNWHGERYRLALKADPNPNWRNTLEPRPTTPDYTDGNWHDWHGGECPVDRDASVDYVLRSLAPGKWSAKKLIWFHNGGDGDIIRFRVIK